MRLSRIDALIEKQENVSYVNRETIEQIQLCKLNQVLKREKKRGGFYSGLPDRLDGLDGLRALPFTTDEELAHNAPGLLLSSQADIQRVLSDATSGTTGAAKRVFYTEGDCERTVELFMAGLGEFIFRGDATMICFPFSGPHGLGELIAEAVSRLGARPLRVGAGRSYGELCRLIARERPTTFVGMPTQLLSMLRFCGRGSLERALVSGDACPQTVLKSCEQMLGTRLFPHYGSREMGLGGAISCDAHEGMHLRENHVIAEIVDEAGQVLPEGEYGELVISTVGMEAMPLIRYRTGDYTRFLPWPCPCGSEVRRLDTVQRKGESAQMLALDNALFSMDAVIDHVVMREGERIVITALTDGGISEADIRRCAESALNRGGICVRLKRAAPEDRPLYKTKRTIIENAMAAPEAVDNNYFGR